jgi:hypothetical protein
VHREGQRKFDKRPLSDVRGPRFPRDQTPLTHCVGA